MAKKKQYKPAKNKRRKKGATNLNKKMLIAIAFVVVAMSGVGGVGWYVLSHKVESNVKAGDAKFESGEFKKAYKLYGKAVRKEPTNILYVEKLRNALVNIVPVTPNSASSTYNDYLGILTHRARYNPLDVDAQLALAEEIYNAAWLTGGVSYWRQLREVTETGLGRVYEDNPRRHELLLYRGLASLRIEDASMTDTYDENGNVRFPGEDDLEEVINQDPGNATAWAAITHGRMAVYYRLDANGETKQAKRNKILAYDTLQRAVEVAGDSFEVSAVVIRERILHKIVLRQQLLINPNSEIQDEIDLEDQRIIDARQRILKAYNPEIHYARTGEVVSLLFESGENGRELAEELLRKTIEKHHNDFGRKYMLASILFDLHKVEEASKVANEILNSELQTVGLHAFELFSIRPIAAHLLIRMNLNESVLAEDEEKKLAYIDEAKQYREQLFELLSGQEDNALLLISDGSIALAEERFVDAAEKLNEAIYRNPDSDASVYQQAAFALSKINSKGLAVSLLKVAIEKTKSPNLELYIQKARLELGLSDSKAAALTLSVLSSTALENEEVQEVLNLIAMKQSVGTNLQITDLTLSTIAEAENLMLHNKFDEAILVLNKSIEKTPETDWRLYLTLSNAYSQKGDKSVAIDWIEKAIELCPTPTILSPLLYSLQTDNRIEALILTIESKDGTEITEAEELAVSLYQLGMNLLGESNRWKQRGNRIEKQKAKDLSDLALEKSEHYQQLAESLGADMSRILSLRFNKSLSQGDFAKAEDLLSEVIKSSTKENRVDSLRVSLLIARAQEEQKQGNGVESVIMLEYALGIAKKMSETYRISDSSWRTLGRVHSELGHQQESIDAYAESYRISPKDKENIRRYVGALAVQNKDHQRLLRLLHTAMEQFPSDKQLQEMWLDIERVYGEAWKVLTHRLNTYAIDPEDRLNMLELALALTELQPHRTLLRDSNGDELYTSRVWGQLGSKQQQRVLADTRKSWAQMINQILESADEQVDSSTRLAALHASIHKNLGQLSRSSEIWDRFIKSYEEDERYTVAVISAADFLHQAGRTDQSVRLLDAARDKQSEKHEIDSALGSLYFIGGDYGKAIEYFEPAVRATGSDTLRSRMIEALARDGRFDEAEKALIEIESKDTEYSDAMLKALICRVQSEQLLAQGNIDGGRAAIKRYRDAVRVAINLDRRIALPYILLCKSLLSEYQLTQNKALLEEALFVADEAVSIEEQTEQFVIVRADVLQADGQLNRAIDRLERYLSEKPKSISIRARLIEAYLDSDNVTRALAVAKRGVEVDSSNSVWHRRLGDLYIRTTNDRNEGVKSYLTAIQLDPSVSLLMTIDEMTRTDLELPDQELIFLTKNKFSTLHPIAGAIEAKSLQNLDRNRDSLLAMEKSWRAFQQAIDNGWASPAASGSWFLDLAHLFKSNPEEGEAFVRSLVNGPLTHHQYAGLADYYNSLGDEYTEQALDLIATALALPKKDSQARTRLLLMQGAFLVNVGRYEESVKSFRLLAGESDSPLVQNNLAYVIGVYQNKPEEGLKIALEAVKAASRSTSIIDTTSVLYERLGEYRTAAETFDYLLQVDPTNTRAMSKLALLYADHLDEIERGMVIANRARSQKPHSPEVLDALGWCYYRMGNKEQAEDTIRRSLRYGDTMNAYLHLAQIVTDNHEFEEALGHIRMAQELAEDAYSMNSVMALKDDIRKKKAEANK